ncbi:hypothetical protein PoB_007495100 [Plakobranchus ocellatus]|uniref:BZIP domain-containing protein n=1 Tax=Plakobranchus ocellatus TaxID=259542 RepID=A0AAV4DX31_9GAST|nr:hypothetical protein PoB_007495100 [Plakobranchus ocellatus]
MFRIQLRVNGECVIEMPPKSNRLRSKTTDRDREGKKQRKANRHLEARKDRRTARFRRRLVQTQTCEARQNQMSVTDRDREGKKQRKANRHLEARKDRRTARFRRRLVQTQTCEARQNQNECNGQG